jgi:hypothetical protein
LDPLEQVMNHGYTIQSLKLSELETSINLHHKSPYIFGTTSWQCILIASWDINDVSDRFLVEVIPTKDKHTAVSEEKSENIIRQE